VAQWSQKVRRHLQPVQGFPVALLSLGEQNSKVEKNPARKAPHKREDNARIRFLSQEDEYPRLHASVSELFPEHVVEFVVSVHTGMRLSEQYTAAEWSQYHKDRRAIELMKTKNGHQRTVHLNQDAIDAIESQGSRSTDARTDIPARGKQGPLRQPLMVCSVPGGRQGGRLSMARK
jgi:site-specific recombinase XerD